MLGPFRNLKTNYLRLEPNRLTRICTNFVVRRFKMESTYRKILVYGRNKFELV